MYVIRFLIEENSMGLAKDFRDFAIRGNMMDLAVGMIIGAAFTSIVKSLVDDVINAATRCPHCTSIIEE